MTPRTGRPKVDEPRTELVTIRLTEAEKALVESVAGGQLGPWMRTAVLAAARREARKQAKG